MITRDDCATFGFPALERDYSSGSDSVLRISEVCDVLRVERHTVYKLIGANVLPVIRCNARLIYVPKAAVQRLLTPPDGDPSNR